MGRDHQDASAGLAGVVIVAALAAPSAAQVTTRVSVDSLGAQGNGFGEGTAITPDGRYVAFASYASNLVSGDTNASTDVFVRDRVSGTTERSSIDSMGAEGNDDSGRPAISADGRYVCFDSIATNLVAGDTNGVFDVFVRDRATGTTERVSISSLGAQSNGDCYSSAISEDGRYVAFYGPATNLVAGDTNGWWDAFVRDRVSGTTERVNVSSAGVQGNNHSSVPSFSGDGRYVVYESLASNLVSGDTNVRSDVFVRDRVSSTTERVSLTQASGQGNGDSQRASISFDGRYVAFHSFGNNFVSGDTNGNFDVFVRDRMFASTQLVSVSSSGAQGNGASSVAKISSSGRYVAFHSLATNLFSGDTNGSRDVFVRDRMTLTTDYVSVGLFGAQANGSSFSPSVTADGRVGFHSTATNLVGGDTNAVQDVFVRDRDGSWIAFCFGDGTGSACPCANNGSAGNGCASSVHATGANLRGQGISSVSADSFVLVGASMPESSALYFQGSAPIDGGSGTAFGDGLRCVGGAVIRLATKTNVGGTSRYPEGMDAPLSIRAGITAPGTFQYQCWYRNAADYCTPSTFNLTNGLAVVWVD